MQIKVWVHVTRLVPGAGYRANKGIRVRQDHVGFGVAGSENWPCTSRSLVSRQMLQEQPLHIQCCALSRAQKRLASSYQSRYQYHPHHVLNEDQGSSTWHTKELLSQ